MTINLWQKFGTLFETPKLRRRRRRLGEGYGDIAFPIRLGGLGSVVSSPSGVRGGAQAKNGFGMFWAQQNASLTGRNVKIINCISITAWRLTHLDVKSGQIWEWTVLKSGQFSVPNDLVFFSGQALKIRDYIYIYIMCTMELTVVFVVWCNYRSSGLKKHFIVVNVWDTCRVISTTQGMLASCTHTSVTSCIDWFVSRDI